VTFPPDRIGAGMCYLTTKGQVRWVIRPLHGRVQFERRSYTQEG
jgi:hypothetical protein